MARRARRPRWDQFASGCGVWAPGRESPHVGSQISARELLLATQGHFDRIALILRLKDTDFQIRQRFVRDTICSHLTFLSR